MSNEGRPSKYKEDYNELAYNYCLLGAKDTQIAEFLGVCEKTLNNWKHEFPKFLQSIKAGKEIADAQIAASLFNLAKGYECKDTKFATHEGLITDEKEYIKRYPPNAKAIEFWLKNRQPDLWKVKPEEEPEESSQVHIYLPDNGTSNAD